ncbi:hypothetical protein E2P81_ATG04085 [Venturia nashicola]|uniref:N-acetyltransferase domain-containing protein n=1 Tax=Venturia nashicola TaxID=86259 RepID=A0A4Z1PMN6_9PEZI|nr:hypothetical protein E6O75_ATG04185 [Venturia nashicola]TLD37273.1 hypothetical protein E2P81_ATG04085 [Venturia nashicola]
MSDPCDFYTLVFSKSSLYMNEKLETSVAKLVNDAFREIPNFENAPRFEKDSDVSKELGEDGIISIAFDPVPDAGRDLPVACLSAIKYNPPSIEGEEGDPSTPHYRLSAVATLSSPNNNKYRKKGLTPLCLTALLAALPQNSKIWLETAEAANGPYWRKNGFETVKSEMRPGGFWGAEREFEWVVMKMVR